MSRDRQIHVAFGSQFGGTPVPGRRLRAADAQFADFALADGSLLVIDDDGREPVIRSSDRNDAVPTTYQGSD